MGGRCKFTDFTDLTDQHAVRGLDARRAHPFVEDVLEQRGERYVSDLCRVPFFTVGNLIALLAPRG
jgi:hypothetical protein